jgi:hypothetical protein
MPRQRGVELPARALSRHRDRRLHAPEPAEALDHVGEHGDPSRQCDLRSAQPGGRPLSVPALEYVLERVAHLRTQPQPHRELPGHQAVRGLHRHHRLASGDHQRPEQSHATPPRLATADVTDEEARTELVGEVAIGPQRDVVAEPGRLLMRVRVTAQPREQRDVVHDGSLGLLELQMVGDPEPENAGAQHVLHRLAEPEVRGQGDRGDQLRQPHIRLRDDVHAYRRLWLRWGLGPRLRARSMGRMPASLTAGRASTVRCIEPTG